MSCTSSLSPPPLRNYKQEDKRKSHIHRLISARVLPGLHALFPYIPHTGYQDLTCRRVKQPRRKQTYTHTRTAIMEPKLYTIRPIYPLLWKIHAYAGHLIHL
jgi:hypothetical protein